MLARVQKMTSSSQGCFLQADNGYWPLKTTQSELRIDEERAAR